MVGETTKDDSLFYKTLDLSTVLNSTREINSLSSMMRKDDLEYFHKYIEDYKESPLRNPG